MHQHLRKKATVSGFNCSYTTAATCSCCNVKEDLHIPPYCVKKTLFQAKVDVLFVR